MVSLVPIILWMHCHSHITEHRLQSCRGHNHPICLGAFEEVLELAKHAHLHFACKARDFKESGARNILIVHLQIRQRSSQVRTPVHKSVVPVDQALVMKSNESLLHCTAQHGVHCKPLTRPVYTSGNSTQLSADAIAILLLPSPHTFEELVSTKIMPSQLLLLQEETLHNRLGCDAGMISARHPECYMSLHPVPSHKCIFDGTGKGVAQVKRSRYVWRWYHHDEPEVLNCALRLLCIGREVALLLPPCTPCRLHMGRLIATRHRYTHILLLSSRGLYKLHDLLLLLGSFFLFLFRFA
mmetsp:Transcript_24099/g.56075  ORF Transcript_24099/g.56075 Transcript_24099/m.56075 type:complete len:297 (-) Transcript_24099:293-1183(-)